MRAAAAWGQLAWAPGAIGLVAVTAAGVVAGGPGHRGMPMAWTPLVAVFTGAVAIGVVVAAVATLVRVLAAASVRRLAGRPAAARVLAEAAARPLATGERIGRRRVVGLAPLTVAPATPAPLRVAGRLVAGAAGLVLLVAAAGAVPAVAGARGGGLDLAVTAVAGAALLALASRRGPRRWTADELAARHCGGAADVRVIRRGAPPGRRRLVVAVAGAGAGTGAGGRRRWHTLVDLPGWPASAVLRERLASCLPPPVGSGIRGPSGGIAGDPPLPTPPVMSTGAATGTATGTGTAITTAGRPVPPIDGQPATASPSASSAASTDSGSVRGS